MTDSTVDRRRRRTDIRPDLDRHVAIACFGTACTIGLAFAFVGLETHSFWYDELFTARLLEPANGTTLLSRIATDVHPPLYLLALALFTQLFGEGDAALRSFSAIAACGAILVFIAATRSAFSLPARLFGAAMATGSLFWFYQAQNARSYALSLLISAAVMAIGLSLLRGRSRRRLLVPGLLALMIAGSFVHFYVMYVCLAVLIVLGLYERRDRLMLSGAAVFLLRSRLPTTGTRTIRPGTSAFSNCACSIPSGTTAWPPFSSAASPSSTADLHLRRGLFRPSPLPRRCIGFSPIA